MGLAVGAEAFDQIVDTLHLEAFGQVDGRDVDGMEAECTLAVRAEEVDVLVIERAVIMSLAHLVFGHPRTVLDGVYQVMCQQERECSEDAGAIHRVQLVIQFPQRQGPPVAGERAID